MKIIVGNNGILKKIRDIIGNLTDFVSVPYSFGTNSVMAFLTTGYYHIHGASFVYPDKANPVELTAEASAWGESGSIVEVIPADTIIKNFDLHWMKISDISATLHGVIDIYAGGIGEEVKIGSVPLSRTTAFSSETFAPVQVPQQTANTRISCKFSSSTVNADTVLVKFTGHVYSGSLT